MLNIFKKKLLSEEEQLVQWEKAGKPAPPPHIVKQIAIREYQQRYKLHTLVETGTYLGDMVAAMRPSFAIVHNIELSEKLYKKAQKRFSGDSGVHLWQGDSGNILHKVVPQLAAPAIFWLDGHYSGGITALGDKECPVIEELNAIFSSNLPHIILIDDARLFNGTHDYPTIDELKNIGAARMMDYELTNQDDIIRLAPHGRTN